MNSHQHQPQPQSRPQQPQPQQQQHQHHHQHLQQHRQLQPHHSGTIESSGMVSAQTHHSNQLVHSLSQPQKNQLLPLLLSSSSNPNSNEQLEQADIDHELVNDRIIGLDNDFSDTSPMLTTTTTVEGNAGSMMSHQQQKPGDMNTGRRSSCQVDNQLSSSSEDLLNLLLELDREPSGLIGFHGDSQIDQDERAGIENIRKQLMSCEVQSEQNQTATGGMSPIISQMVYPPQQPPTTAQRNQTPIHQQSTTVVTQQLITQTAPVIPHHQQSQQMSTSSSTLHHQQRAADQSMLFGMYSTNTMSTVPVSTSGQPFTPQPQQHVTRISQASTLPTLSNSPSPSWQQQQLSPYSPQNQHNNSRSQSQRPIQHHHTIHTQNSVPHQPTTSPQLHATLRDTSSSQPVSPSTTEPSPVVKKNPLLNAQLVNTRVPPMNQGRFLTSPTNVLNQNPILNAKLSQGPFVPGAETSVIGSPVNQRFVQSPQQSQNFSYDVASQQPNAHSVVFGSNEQQTQQLQSNMRVFGSPSPSNIGSACNVPTSIGSTSPSEGSSQHLKHDIRRKVQSKQPQTTSLLKQLLSDDS